MRLSATKSIYSAGQFAFVILLASMSVDFAAAQDKDRVYPIKGAAATGRIIERNKERVVVEVRGNNQNFPSNEIQRIVYDGEPSQLSRGKDSVFQGQYDQAEEELKKVDADSLKSDEMKEDLYFYRLYTAGALALRGKGDPAAASKNLLAWVRKYPNSHNFFATSEMLGNLAMATGQPDQASKYFGAYAGAPFADYKLRGSYLQGRALLAQNQPAEAKQKFDTVAQAKVSEPALIKLQKLATIAAIKCVAADGKTDEAINLLEKMVEEGDSTDAELFSELFNALGALYQGQNNHYDAILSYLKTEKLYPMQPEPHAEALYNLSKLWPKVGEPQRGMEAKAELSKLYPTSSWIGK